MDDVGGWSAGDHLAAARAAAWTEIYNKVGTPDRGLVMLDDRYRISAPSELLSEYPVLLLSAARSPQPC